MSLESKQCVPCKGGIPPLTKEEAEKFLAQVPEWLMSEDVHHIEREFKFKNFVEAQRFVNRVGELAEQEGHHPDITFGWGYARDQSGSRY